ncbi:hypothetical protein BJY52DRAFT_353247 [Lactarius psammicola]|nr:hypothetical protein BJY52DRAFT_353247 [Lactarius psammicola]
MIGNGTGLGSYVEISPNNVPSQSHTEFLVVAPSVGRWMIVEPRIQAQIGHSPTSTSEPADPKSPDSGFCLRITYVERTANHIRVSREMILRIGETATDKRPVPRNEQLNYLSPRPQSSASLCTQVVIVMTVVVTIGTYCLLFLENAAPHTRQYYHLGISHQMDRVHCFAENENLR